MNVQTHLMFFIGARKVKNIYAAFLLFELEYCDIYNLKHNEYIRAAID